ncbi:MAG: ssDNA endonuclease and repair protein rad10 [Cirrosporium novae-zelandiae]|nr:MAG: ssDNA endonuclease and repair protein rad10 [Cirrosporium novae-zelandiae]
MDDDYGDDASLAAAFTVAEKASTTPKSIPPAKILSRPSAAPSSSSAGPKIQQPTPQKLPQRPLGSSILVSTRQKGNPILSHIHNIPWEWASIPADYVLGATTCALFLSLKYHRLHPEYIYSRIRVLGHTYNLRILLVLVDIENHEDPLRELAKTGLVNDLTLILCWSATEAGRYLELYKSFENAGPGSIRKHDGGTYAERLIEFVTGPRGVNKTDAVGLVGAFGSIKAAVNAGKEEIGLLEGWGEVKVVRWCNTVREPFRVRRAGKSGEETNLETAKEGTKRRRLNIIPISSVPARENIKGKSGSGTPATSVQSEVGRRSPKRAAEESPWGPEEDELAAMAAAEIEASSSRSQPTIPGEKPKKPAREEESMSQGIEAALAKLREKG